MAKRKVRVEDAVGMVLPHDMTKIVPGEYKGPAFKKGHVVREEDIPHLKSIGKDHIFMLDLTSNQLHENDAASRIAKATAGANTVLTDPSEGRINIKAAIDGVTFVNAEAVTRINSINGIVFSTLHHGLVVKEGDILAGAKVVPLVIDKRPVERVEEAAAKYPEIIGVRPMRPLEVAIVVTGNEVFHRRIPDRFGPVMIEKLNKYGAKLFGIDYQPDDGEKIAGSIRRFRDMGAEVIIATGGMAVDPDDKTAKAIRSSGAKPVTYGTPVLPGAVFMLAYMDKVPVLGLPACGMYSKVTVFDIIFPRILAGIEITKKDFAAMGYGGLCRNCPVCTYPQCAFGR